MGIRHSIIRIVISDARFHAAGRGQVMNGRRWLQDTSKIKLALAIFYFGLTRRVKLPSPVNSQTVHIQRGHEHTRTGN